MAANKKGPRKLKLCPLLAAQNVQGVRPTTTMAVNTTASSINFPVGNKHSDWCKSQVLKSFYHWTLPVPAPDSCSTETHTLTIEGQVWWVYLSMGYLIKRGAKMLNNRQWSVNWTNQWMLINDGVNWWIFMTSSQLHSISTLININYIIQCHYWLRLRYETKIQLGTECTS